MTIARQDTHTDKADIWSRLAEPLPNGVVYWRQDGKVINRDGKYLARFVAYIEANTARERLDAVVPGDWDLTLELLPPIPSADMDGVDTSACAFKARLQIMGVIREDVGSGRDYKSAATDAFKRAAVRFGIAHELYAFEQNWVQVDGEGRYAKPLEDPGVVYARRFGPTNGASHADTTDAAPNGSGEQRRPPPRARAQAETGTSASTSDTDRSATSTSRAPAPATQSVDDLPDDQLNGAGLPVCPKCGGKVWDNRLSKRNPKAPDYKCRDRSCDGVIWPAGHRGGGNGKQPVSMDSSPLGMNVDDIPF